MYSVWSGLVVGVNVVFLERQMAPKSLSHRDRSSKRKLESRHTRLLPPLGLRFVSLDFKEFETIRGCLLPLHGVGGFPTQLRFLGDILDFVS